MATEIRAKGIHEQAFAGVQAFVFAIEALNMIRGGAERLVTLNDGGRLLGDIFGVGTATGTPHFLPSQRVDESWFASERRVGYRNLGALIIKKDPSVSDRAQAHTQLACRGVQFPPELDRYRRWCQGSGAYVMEIRLTVPHRDGYEAEFIFGFHVVSWEELYGPRRGCAIAPFFRSRPSPHTLPELQDLELSAEERPLLEQAVASVATTPALAFGALAQDEITLLCELWSEGEAAAATVLDILRLRPRSYTQEAEIRIKATPKEGR